MLHKPQARLIAGLVLATCALGTVTGLASLKLDQAFEHSAHITRDTTHRIEITLRLQKLLQRAVIPVHHYHIEGSSVQREHFALLASQIGDTLAEAQEPHDGAHPEEFAEIAASWQTIRSQVTAILAMPDPNAGGLRAIHERIHGLDVQVRALSDQVGLLHDADRARTRSQLASAARWNRTLTRVVLGAFFLTVLSLLLGAFSIMRSQAVLRELSMRDALTGLFNRREFQARLEGHLDQARRHGQPCSVLLLDVDHFKVVNDTYGHDVGDRVLQELAGLVSGVVRQTDVVARFGGEEIVALLPDTDEHVALVMGDRIREAVAAHHGFSAPDGTAFRITVSIGVASFPSDAPREDALIRAADQAMYAAKHSGRNRVARRPA
ncbi:hypothetical protein GCM10008955_26920 [Deinococcus malanensis]|uniref:GGDEF domain-containing protein n=1 Tax=Deinococcus malanensis TaxID=1706855 RepID=A0ABQ2EYV7_9DEIO|nr:GGDEF domain-containing protein [Deinococcus malanensis]GGK31702.1 hypothetical protein GCM10008955_26920 [Deinococcus malanensis]